MFLAIMINILTIVSTAQAVFKPHNRGDLKAAIDACVPDTGPDTCAAGSNGAIGTWDVSQVTDMSQLFHGKAAFNADISNWDVSKVTNMAGMFGWAKSFNQDLTKWDVSSVTNMPRLFASTNSFNGDISTWDVSKVTNMKRMFTTTKVFNSDLSKWNVSQVTNMEGMFIGTEAFNKDLSNWDVSSVTDMDNMFWAVHVFSHTLCGAAWLESKASKVSMFNGRNTGLPHTGKIAGPCCHSCTTTTTTTTSTSTTSTSTVKSSSSCSVEQWDLTSATPIVSVDTGASPSIKWSASYTFPNCTVSNDFKFSLHKLDSSIDSHGKTILSCGTKLADDLHTSTTTTFSRGLHPTTANQQGTFELAKLDADHAKPSPTVLFAGSSVKEKTLKFCMRAVIKVGAQIVKAAETAITASLDMSADFKIEEVDVNVVGPVEHNVVIDLAGKVTAYKCDRDSSGKWVHTNKKQDLTMDNNILNVCVTGVASAMKCANFFELILSQNRSGSVISEKRAHNGAAGDPNLTSLSVATEITDKFGNKYKGCVAQTVLDDSFFSGPAPPAVTVTGTVIMGLARRRLRGRVLQAGGGDTNIEDGAADFKLTVQPHRELTVQPHSETPMMSAAPTNVQLGVTAVVSAASLALCFV